MKFFNRFRNKKIAIQEWVGYKKARYRVYILSEPLKIGKGKFTDVISFHKENNKYVLYDYRRKQLVKVPWYNFEFKKSVTHQDVLNSLGYRLGRTNVVREQSDLTNY